MPTVTIKGGFWPENGVTTFTTAHTTSRDRRRAAMALNGKGMAAIRELMLTLNGVAAGAAALATRTRIAASEELGGVRAIETETLLDRATVADDVTDINDDILSMPGFDSTPPANLDGNPLGTR